MTGRTFRVICLCYIATFALPEGCASQTFESLGQLKEELAAALSKVTKVYNTVDALLSEKNAEKVKKEHIPFEMDQNKLGSKKTNERVATLLDKIGEQTSDSLVEQKSAEKLSSELKEIRSLANLDSKQAYHLKAILFNRKRDGRNILREGLTQQKEVHDVQGYLKAIIPRIILDLKLGEKEIYDLLRTAVDGLSKSMDWTTGTKRKVLRNVSSYCLSKLGWYYKQAHNTPHKHDHNQQQIIQEMAKQLHLQQMNLSTVKKVAKALSTALGDQQHQSTTKTSIWLKILSQLARQGHLKEHL